MARSDDEFEVLGEIDRPGSMPSRGVFDNAVVGDDGSVDVGFDWKVLTNAGTELLNQGIDTAQNKANSEAQQKRDRETSEAAIAADVQATRAEANAAIAAADAAASKKPEDIAKANAAQAVAMQTGVARDAICSTLSPGASAIRVRAAQEAQTKALTASLEAATSAANDPTSAAKRKFAQDAVLKANAAQATVSRATGTLPPATAAQQAAAAAFLQKNKENTLRNVGIVAGVVAVLGTVAALLLRRKKR